jgi:hypothetical protein
MKIHNLCKKAPSDIGQLVIRCFEWFDQSHLEGLGYVILVDYLDESVEKYLPANLKIDLDKEMPYFGWYVPVHGDVKEAHITLCIMEVLNGMPAYLRFDVLMTLRIMRTLAHEVGHHVNATHEEYMSIAKHDGDEETANAYADEILRRMLNKTRYKVGIKIIKEIAKWYYVNGILDWEGKKYRSANDRFLYAWSMDPELPDVGDFYWKSRTMLESG